MAQFKVKALKSNGERYVETIQAESADILREELEANGEQVISVTLEEKKENWLKSISFGGVKSQEKITATKNLSTMLKAGISISRSLLILKRQARNQKFAKILSDVHEQIEGGSTFSDALKKHSEFSPLYVSMVRSGEEGGNLHKVLMTLGQQMEKTDQLKKRVKGAMIYPTVIFSVMIIIASLMLAFVVPTLVSTFEGVGVELPASTQFIIFISNSILNHTLLLIVLFSALISGVYYSIAKTTRGKRSFDFFILHIPVIKNMVKEVNAARTSRTLSSLLASGVGMVDALEITGDVIQNSYFKPVLAEAAKKIQKGDSVSAVFIKYEHLYPVLVGEMMSVGEETGKTSEMLMNIADYFENEVDQKTKDLSTIIEPVLMVLIGAAVGFFAVSMLGPVYSIMDQI